MGWIIGWDRGYLNHVVREASEWRMFELRRE